MDQIRDGVAGFLSSSRCHMLSLGYVELMLEMAQLKIPSQVVEFLAETLAKTPTQVIQFDGASTLKLYRTVHPCGYDCNLWYR